MSTITTSRRRCRWDRRREPVTPRLRPLRRDDGPAIDAVFAGLSPQSRYLRFHTPMPVLSAAGRRALLDVDGRTHAALVAEVPTVDGWAPAGVARLIALTPTRAELAVSVVDEYQGRGIGRLLLDALGALALDLGYGELFGDVLRENVRIVRLLRSVFPGARLAWNDGVLRSTCRTDRSVGPITDEEILADLMF